MTMPNLIAGAGVPFTYCFPPNNTVFTLAANQLVLNQVVPIFTQAEFLWRGLMFVSTGAFSIRIQDGEQFYLSEDLVPSVSLPHSAGDPFMWEPNVPYPAGGKILIDLQDTSGAPNSIQLAFIGENKYRLRLSRAA